MLTMLENIGLQKLVDETVTVERAAKAVPTCPFIPAIVLGLYAGSARLNQLVAYLASLHGAYR